MIDPRGRFALSLAGRDKGRRCVIVAVEDEAHVRIADGRTHKIAKPKKKKLMHLRIEEGSADLGAMPPLQSGAADAFLRRIILQREASTQKADNKEG